jgi:aryl-alcohol dehydrogenase-like predicted oxidoreductase
MKKNSFGALDQVSRLTLGGGGIGQAWGPTSREEAIATLRDAVDGGIDLLDTAPLYRNCESIVGETFGGQLPDGLRVTTKCGLGSPEPEKVERALTQSLEGSLAAMKIDHVDIFFLHSNICADDYVYANRPDLQNSYATRWTIYAELVVPALE